MSTGRPSAPQARATRPGLFQRGPKHRLATVRFLHHFGQTLL